MSFFSTDSPIYRFLSRFWDMIKLNFIWLVCSIPIVTIGAATVAAYDVTLKMIDEKEGYIIRQFLKAFKKNLKQGIPLGVLVLALTYSIYIDFEIFNKVEGNPIVFLILGIIGIILLVTANLYAFPLSARYENSLVGTYINSIRICGKFWGRTLLLVVLILVELMIWDFNMVTIIIGVLIGPACMFLTVSGFALYIFRNLEKEPGAVSNPEVLEEEARQMRD